MYVVWIHPNSFECMTKGCIVTVRGMTAYSQSRFHNTEKLQKELSDDYERRTWRNRLHVNEDGHVMVPPLAFKNCMSEIAKFLGQQIPGKGKSTYTKHFEAGIQVINEPMIRVNGKPIHKDEVPGEAMFVPADGIRGSGKRVMKTYPMVPKYWTTTVVFEISDSVITDKVFFEHLEQAGRLIGIGTFRVRNNGTLGRFMVEQEPDEAKSIYGYRWLDNVTIDQYDELGRIS